VQDQTGNNKSKAERAGQGSLAGQNDAAPSGVDEGNPYDGIPKQLRKRVNDVLMNASFDSDQNE